MQLIIRAGHIAAILMFFLFALLWIHETRKSGKERPGGGTMFNAAGFGLLPGLAVWKIFEPYYGLEILSSGKELFDPLGPILHLTRGERFAPERIELAALLIAFAAVIIWLIARREPLPGNGDLFLTVICIWSAIRVVTETLREYPLRVQGISVFTATSIAAEIAVMIVWTVRRGRKQKNAVMTALEWLAILACSVIHLLQDSGTLSMGTQIVNLVVTLGCSALTAALILSAGKDSRET